MSFNSLLGLSLGSGSAYRENTIAENTLGTVTGGLDRGANVCNGTLSCP